MWNFQELKTPHDLQRRRAKHQKLKISSFSPSSKLKREKLYKDWAVQFYHLLYKLGHFELCRNHIYKQPDLGQLGTRSHLILGRNKSILESFISVFFIHLFTCAYIVWVSSPP
jgi:hypothetical protein